MRRSLFIALLGLIPLHACSCGPRITTVPPGSLVLEPGALELTGWMTQPVSSTLAATNVGGAAFSVPVTVTSPFSVDLDELTLSRGQTRSITVSVTPEIAGFTEGVLRIGDVEVPVRVDARALPPCAPDTCTDRHFDFERGECIAAAREEGLSCENTCVTGGQCAAGVCVGTLRGCDDHDLCTVDACSESAGCSHAPRVCPAPSSPCQVAQCDQGSGCGFTDADDGTLCGPDDCLDSRVDVCIAGRCVSRTRPGDGRCTNTWVSLGLSPRARPSMAWDPVNERVLLHGGAGGRRDTWHWNGSIWQQLTPAQPGPFLYGNTSLATDPVRRRVVAVTAQGDTWEWDGQTWLNRSASKPDEEAAALAWDGNSGRVLAFGGTQSNGSGSDATWTWDGARWLQSHPASAPIGRHSTSMEWDPVRRRVVLFGGEERDDTWEWDGAKWLQRSPLHVPRAQRDAELAWNPVTQRVLLTGGRPAFEGPLDEAWEWDGNDWISVASAPGVHQEHGLATDFVRSQVVLFGGLGLNSAILGETWTFTTSWVNHTPPTPGARTSSAMAWDEARHRVVLFGGFVGNATAADTWEWDGADWRLVSTSGPSPRGDHAMAWDPVLRRVMLTGGRASPTSASLADVWFWDGTVWTQQQSPPAPPRSMHVLVSDPVRQRVVMHGGDQLGDTWEWDGTSWTDRTVTMMWFQPLLGGWDPSASEVVISGDRGTWSWTSSGWTQRGPVPAVSNWSAMVGTLVLDPYSQGTWRWTGTTWVNLMAGAHPPAVPFGARPAGVFDADRQRAVFMTNSGLWTYLP